MMVKIAPFSEPGSFWRGNLHTHSDLSDGRLSPADVIHAYKAAGYDFMTLSDHFMRRFDWPLADTRALRSDGFTTIIGAELHANITSTGDVWHILATGLPLDFAPNLPDETGPQLARRAATAGAYVTIAHPAWSQLTLEDGNSIDAAHAVEIYNHGCFVEVDRGDGWYLLDQILNQGTRLNAIATDDAHLRIHADDAFGGWINVKSESLDPDDLLTAIKAGHFYSSQGPQIHDISLTGNLLEIDCSPVDMIVVVGGTSRSVVQMGRSITTATLDVNELATGMFQGKPPPWIRVTVMDHGGKRAWSNPIWRDDL